MQGLSRLGFGETKLRRHMIDLEAARKGNENVSTPREMLTLLERSTPARRLMRRTPRNTLPAPAAEGQRIPQSAPGRCFHCG